MCVCVCVCVRARARARARVEEIQIQTIPYGGGGGGGLEGVPMGHSHGQSCDGPSRDDGPVVSANGCIDHLFSFFTTMNSVKTSACIGVCM